MILKYKKILTFFAHPDDETLAAGATINKLSKNGSRVYVAIPATGINARKNILKKTVRDKKLLSLHRDTFKALSIIGVKKSDIFIGDFNDSLNILFSAQKLYKDFAEIEYRLSGLFFVLNKENYGFTHLINGMKIDYDYHSIINELFPTLQQHSKVQKLLRNFKSAME